ncbi:MAG TPA: tetratricopeptide repeat protein [Pyrinomonadaceae bacterium]|nr:tetratricopeptide repeat protein [Pyrinomonadaceae bacterium]
MSKKAFASSLLAVYLMFAFVQHGTTASAGIFDWSTSVAEQVAAEEPVAVDSNTDGTTKDSADTTKKRGNGFVRALSAPFRALGRLFGGSGKKNDQQQQSRRITSKEAEKFESTTLTRIKDATTPVVTPSSSDPAASSSTAQFESYLSRARQLLLAGDVDGAINELTSATAINQRSAEANKLLGVAYESKGWRDSALRSFEMAVTLDEDNAEHLNNLGFFLYKTGEYERATKFLKRAAKIAQNNPRIWNNLGLVQCERGKFDDAYKSFVRAVGEYQGRMNIAAQLQQRGHAKDAIKHLETAQAMQPNSTDVLNKLVSLYEMTGRQSDAETARRTLIALKTSAEANK